MKSDGSGQVNVSNHFAADSNARWSPSGSQVVFTSTRKWKLKEYKVNADGTGLVNLTQNASTMTGPTGRQMGRGSPSSATIRQTRTCTP